jgi:hypothetical protein
MINSAVVHCLLSLARVAVGYGIEPPYVFLYSYVMYCIALHHGYVVFDRLLIKMEREIDEKVAKRPEEVHPLTSFHSSFY